MRPLAGCAALALTAHAALLIWVLHGRPVAGLAGASSPALQVRVAAPGPDAAAVATPPMLAAQPDATVDIPAEKTGATPAAGQAGTTDAGAPPQAAPGAPADGQPAPLLDADEPPIPLPDAPLPEGGAGLIAFVRVDAQGQVDTVDVAAETPLPGAFSDVVKLALQRSHMRPALAEGQVSAPQAAAYCLRVRFEPGEPAASIRWLPAVAPDRARCLRQGGAAKSVQIERR